MDNPKQEVAAAVCRAQVELDHALAALDEVQEADPTSLEFHTHALNNYLTISTASLELLQTMLADSATAQITSLLDGLQHTTRLMAYTVREIMKRPNTKDVPLRRVPLQMKILARRACHYYQRIAERKHIRVTGEIASDIPPILTDNVAVGVVLENFLSNAVKYSTHDSSIWLRVERQENEVVVTVEDQGPGLSPEDHAQLFQRGAKLTPRPTGGEQSRGYGLAVAKDLIEKIGGKIGCDTQLGKGSKFWFRLPIQEIEPAAVEAKQE